MKPSEEIDLFKISRSLLQFMGETYDHTPNRIIVFRIFNSVIMVYTGIFIIANFFHVTRENRVETMQGLITVIHVLLKYFFYMFFKSDIIELLRDEFEKFWNYGHMDKHVTANTVRVYKATEFLQASFLAVSFVIMLLYHFRPIFTGNNPFPFDAWVSGVMILDILTLACQYYFMCILTFPVFGYDAIYLCLCVRTVAQVKLLKNRLRYFQEKLEVNVGHYIECHQLLLSTFTRLRRLYSSMLLFHYFVTLITACVDIYEVLMGRNSAADITAKAISICAIFTQFAFYTIPAEMVAFELSDVSNYIYLSNWYSNNANVQKQLLFMMTKSQHQLYFTGGGLIDINVRTFGSVVRTSFSFYTILRNVLIK